MHRRRGAGSGGRRRWLWIVVAILGLAWTLDLVAIWQRTNFHDLDVFLRAAQRVVSGESIYADNAAFAQALREGTFRMNDHTIVWPYAYPPLLAVTFVPALYLPFEIIGGLWWVMNASCLLLTCLLSSRSLGLRGPEHIALALAMLTAFEPAVSALRLGQVEPLLGLLLALGLYAGARAMHDVRRSNRWDAIGGISLGLAAALKVFPGALIALLVWKRRWRPLLWAAGTAIAGVVLPAIITEFAIDEYLAYSSLYGIAGEFASFPLNQSLNGFFSRNLVDNVFTATLRGVHRPDLAVALTVVCSAVLLVLTAWLTRPREVAKDGEVSRWGLEYACVVTVLLLVSPHSQVYAFVWALIPLIILGSLAAKEAVTKPLWLASLIVAYLLIGRRFVLLRPGLTRIVQAHIVGGTLLLWGSVAYTLWRRPWTVEYAVGGTESWGRNGEI